MHGSKARKSYFPANLPGRPTIFRTLRYASQTSSHAVVLPPVRICSPVAHAQPSRNRQLYTELPFKVERDRLRSTNLISAGGVLAPPRSPVKAHCTAHCTAQRVGIRRPGGVPPEVSGCPSPNPACAFRYAPGSPSMFTHREDQDPNPSYRAPRGLRTTVRGPYCHLAIAAPFGAACANRTEQRDHPSVCLGASCGASV